MKSKFLLIIVIAVAAVASFGQKPGVPLRNVPFKTATEISDADWSKLALALDREDWKKASAITIEYMQLLTAENEKKQLAQLRYIRLFSLAGEVLKAIETGDSAGAERVWGEIDIAIEPMINKELVMPARPFMASCKDMLNVICPVKDQPEAMRITATNQEGDAIHAFDYVVFDVKPDLLAFVGKKVFLGGILRRAEFNDDKTKPWALRLFYNKGELRIIMK